MREIKFRGKRIADGDLFYGNLITKVDDDFKIKKAYIHVRLSPVDFSGDSMTSKLSLHEVDPETIMQYTGLKDKNGKEIYEGDIVKQTYHLITGSYDDQMAYDGHHIGEVIITAYKGVCMRNPLCYSEETDETTKCNQYKNVAGYRCEVIGNIYEHAHLIEVSA